MPQAVNCACMFFLLQHKLPYTYVPIRIGQPFLQRNLSEKERSQAETTGPLMIQIGMMPIFVFSGFLQYQKYIGAPENFPYLCI